jgi:hypothetical protein
MENTYDFDFEEQYSEDYMDEQQELSFLFDESFKHYHDTDVSYPVDW